MSRKQKKPLLEKLLITDIAAEGKAIARSDGIIVFVSGCVPGDVVDVQVVRNRKRYFEGIPVKFHAYSENRTEPFCRHFGSCGGCKWQQLPYEEQLKGKQKWVADSLERIGKVEGIRISPILGSDQLTGYRNKLEFTFSNGRWLTEEEVRSGEKLSERRALGFHIPGKFDKVLDIAQCHLQPEPSNQIRNFVRRFAMDHNLGFYDMVNREGFLRNLTIRNNQAGEFMVILSFFRDEKEQRELLMNALRSSFPMVTSLGYVINPKANDTLEGLDVILHSGSEYIEERMENLRFRISAKSFFQTNTAQACRLYAIARDFASLTGRETVYDLYTGTGTIALFLASGSKKVIGIESVSQAVEDAWKNAELNGITNVSFMAGDVRGILEGELVRQHGLPDVLITDPPRAGMHAGVIRSILSLEPQRIVYISCNPATQARDIQLLSDRYRVEHCQPVDMFPYTHHVENVALLVRR